MLLPNFAEIKIPFQDRAETIGILGENDEFLRVLNDSFACRIIGRGTDLSINGEEGEVNAASQVIEALLLLYRQGTKLTMHEVRYSIKLVKAGQSNELKSLFTDVLTVTSRGKCVRPKTIGQKIYIDAIRRHSITFGLGPAGTGKTYLAVVMAVMALRNNEVDKLILTRPAVEAGERLGFLPGDLQEKIDPYLRPLYDALQDILGLEAYQKLLARKEGIGVEPASAASIAGLKKLCDEGVVDKGETVTCVVTGHLLKDPNTAIDACTKPKQVDADIDTLRKILMNK